MFGVDGRADVILDAFIKEEKSGGSRFDIDSEGPDAPYYSQLKQAGYIKAIGALGCDVVVVSGVMPAGREHANKVRQAKIAADFPILSVEDDVLFRKCNEIYSRGDTVGGEEMSEENAEALRRLHKQGLIDVMYAEDRPYFFKCVTDKGMKYTEDLIPEGGAVNITNSPTFVNNNSVTSEANAIATALSSITITIAIKAIDQSNLNDEEKREARGALYELEEASEAKETGRFMSALEKIASIIKNVAETGNAVIPLITKLASVFIQ